MADRVLDPGWNLLLWSRLIPPVRLREAAVLEQQQHSGGGQERQQPGGTGAAQREDYLCLNTFLFKSLQLLSTTKY